MDHTSIHWRRRWFYALWAALLGAALGAYALWVIPGRKGTARLVVAVRLHDTSGLRAQLGSSTVDGVPNNWRAMDIRNGRFVGELMVPLAYRRWMGTVHIGRCHVSVLMRFQKGGETRYYPIDLREDVSAGVFSPGRRLTVEYDGLAWERMYEDIPRLSRLP